MGGVAVIGEAVRVRGYALGGAAVVVAETPEEARRAWRELPPQTDVVILTPAAAAAEPSRLRQAWPMTVVMA